MKEYRARYSATRGFPKAYLIGFFKMMFTGLISHCCIFLVPQKYKKIQSTHKKHTKKTQKFL